MKLIFQKRLAEFLLDKALALACELPVREAQLLHNVVDVIDDPLDDHVRIGVFRFLE
jgi:hypothetical protein